ncbi:hypothetical protein [Acidipropionibacterium timonense]|nr:hypothetical protein [Acidipropionibacterium timonense]
MSTPVDTLAPSVGIFPKVTTATDAGDGPPLADQAELVMLQ